jgi:DNA-binding transcriptional regulator YdaS (Cro superfamily)
MTNQITPERRRQLAEKHSVHQQYLYQCLTGRREMGPAEAVRLESETSGELTRKMLCQKTYAGIWPELIAPVKEAV